MALRSISVFTSPSASPKRVSAPDRPRGNVQYYLPLGERFWISFCEDFSDDYYYVNKVRTHRITIYRLSRYSPPQPWRFFSSFFFSTCPLLTYLGHSSVTRVLLQTKDRKTLFEVKIYISPVTFNFSNITVFLDRSPDFWFLLCILLTTLYFQSHSILLLN